MRPITTSKPIAAVKGNYGEVQVKGRDRRDAYFGNSYQAMGLAEVFAGGACGPVALPRVQGVG